MYSLKLFIGPMYAGKTTHLIEHINQESIVLDFSESSECFNGTLTSHKKEKVNCIKIHRLCDLFITTSIDIIDQFRKTKRILINEAQFFSDLLEFIKTIEKYNVEIFVYGLDGDFERKPFGQILNIIPYCNEVVKLNGSCYYCNQPSLFSKRIVNNKEQYLTDETAYRPVCRKCYLE